MFENIWILPLHQLYVIFSEFEGSSFKAHVSWRAWEHETEINMNNMARSINKNIIIMPIFYLK